MTSFSKAQNTVCFGAKEMCLRKLRFSSQNIFSLNVIRNCREYLGSPMNPRMFLSVLLNVCFEVRWLVAWKVAMCALVMFLHTVNGGVGHQVIIPTKWLVALQTTVLLDPIVSLLVMMKATPSCKYFRTQIARCLFRHLHLSPPFPFADFIRLLLFTPND